MGRMAYSEAEYSIALGKIDRYSIFLSQCINEYIEILDYLSEEAIKDDAIKAKILKLKGNISLYPTQLEDLHEELKNCMILLAKSLEEADKIVMPDPMETFFQNLMQMFK